MNLWANIWLLAHFEFQKSHVTAKLLGPCQVVVAQKPVVDRQLIAQWCFFFVLKVTALIKTPLALQRSIGKMNEPTAKAMR